jgi:hypothetical protein
MIAVIVAGCGNGSAGTGSGGNSTAVAGAGTGRRLSYTAICMRGRRAPRRAKAKRGTPSVVNATGSATAPKRRRSGCSKT